MDQDLGDRDAGTTTGSSSSGVNSGMSKGGNGSDSNPEFPSAGADWGQDIANELFQTPNPNYDPSSLYGLYQITGEGVASPTRIRLSANTMTVAYKSASGDLVGVRASIQFSDADGKLVVLEGAEAVNGPPCSAARVRIQINANQGYLSRYDGPKVSGDLPLRFRREAVRRCRMDSRVVAISHSQSD